MTTTKKSAEPVRIMATRHEHVMGLYYTDDGVRVSRVELDHPPVAHGDLLQHLALRWWMQSKRYPVGRMAGLA